MYVCMYMQCKINAKCKVNHNLNWTNRCLIYLLSCNICSLQYLGSTTNLFHY